MASIFLTVSSCWWYTCSRLAGFQHCICRHFVCWPLQSMPTEGLAWVEWRDHACVITWECALIKISIFVVISVFMDILDVSSFLLVSNHHWLCGCGCWRNTLLKFGRYTPLSSSSLWLKRWNLSLLRLRLGLRLHLRCRYRCVRILLATFCHMHHTLCSYWGYGQVLICIRNLITYTYWRWKFNYH